MSLSDELAQVGTRLAARESEIASRLGETRARANQIHGKVSVGLEGFHRAARDAGAPHLEVVLSDPRTDDKHLHSVQFDVTRGRHQVIVTVKSKGAITLVGPFKQGKDEGPCKRIDLDDDAGIDAGLAAVLAEFLENAFTP